MDLHSSRKVGGDRIECAAGQKLSGTLHVTNCTQKKSHNTHYSSIPLAFLVNAAASFETEAWTIFNFAHVICRS